MIPEGNGVQPVYTTSLTRYSVTRQGVKTVLLNGHQSPPGSTAQVSKIPAVLWMSNFSSSGTRHARLAPKGLCPDTAPAPGRLQPRVPRPALARPGRFPMALCCPLPAHCIPPTLRSLPSARFSFSPGSEGTSFVLFTEVPAAPRRERAAWWSSNTFGMNG